MSMVPMPNADDTTFMKDFLARCKSRDPDALITLQNLCMLARQGNPQATFALSRLQQIYRNKKSNLQVAAGAVPALLMKPLHWTTGLLVKALSTAGNLVQGAGHIASTPFTAAAHVVAKV